MATKPTERILDWASGGTNTDPGAGVEATGWEVDDRPPAYWWNWILNSFGKWLSYFETRTDAAPIAVGRIATDATPQVLYSAGPALAATPITVFAASLTVHFASAIIDNVENATVQLTQENQNDTLFLAGQMGNTSTLEIVPKDTDGVGIIDVNTTEYIFNYAIWGTGV